MKAKQYLYWLGIVVVLLILLFGSLVLKAKYGGKNSMPEQQVNSMEQSGQYTYQYIEFPENSGEETFDGKIVKIDVKTGKQTVLVPSVQKAYSMPKEGNLDMAFVYITQSKVKPYMYFTTVPLGTEAGMGDLIRYDASTNKFSILKITDYLKGGYNIKNNISPSGTLQVVTKPEYINNGMEIIDRQLYLLDYDADSSKLILTLPSFQTFDACVVDELGCPMEEFAWINDNTVEASIYSPNGSTKDEDGNPIHKLLDKRKININQ